MKATQWMIFFAFFAFFVILNLVSGINAEEGIGVLGITAVIANTIMFCIAIYSIIN